MTAAEDALRAALEAAGLSLQAIPEEQRAMFKPLTEEEVTRLLKLRAGRATGSPESSTREAAESASHGQPNGDC